MRSAPRTASSDRPHRERPRRGHLRRPLPCAGHGRSDASELPRSASAHHEGDQRDARPLPTMLLIGEKVDSFTYDGLQAMPAELQIIQIAPAASQLGLRLSLRHGGARRHPGDTRCARDGDRRPDTAQVAARTIEMRRWMRNIPLRPNAERCADPRRAAPSRPVHPCHHRRLVRGRHRAGHGREPRLPERAFLAARRRAGLGDAAGRRHRPSERASMPSVSSATAEACSRSTHCGRRRNTPSRPSSSAS